MGHNVSRKYSEWFPDSQGVDFINVTYKLVFYSVKLRTSYLFLFISRNLQYAFEPRIEFLDSKMTLKAWQLELACRSRVDSF